MKSGSADEVIFSINRLVRASTSASLFLLVPGCNGLVAAGTWGPGTGLVPSS